MNFLNIQTTMKPKVYVIDDDPNILMALQALFESVGLIVECFESPISFLENFNPSQQGCIISDVRMPIMSGIQMLEQLNHRKNQLPIIFLSGYGDVQMAVNAMKIGARDFVVKPFNNQYLVEQVQKAITLNINQSLSQPSEGCANYYDELSKRERQVMKLVASGKLNKQIAQELCIANSTVEFHRSRLMKKMHATNLAQLIKCYLWLQENGFSS